MTRLIDADALKKAIEEVEDNYDGYEPNDLGKFMSKVDDLIDEAPTVEPERPKNMTNGEKLLSIFDGARIYGSDKKERTIKVCVDMEIINVFDLDWWNAEYKENEEEE